MRQRLAGFVLALLCATRLHAAEALRPEDFVAQFPLAGAAEGLHAVELTESVYRAATERGLRDVRAFNAIGEALPLAVLPPGPAAPPDVRPIDLTMAALPAPPDARDAALQAYALRFERDRARAVIEIRGDAPGPASAGAGVGGYLVDARPAKDLSGRLRLVFAADAADFAGRVELLGSEDLVNWRRLASGPLARERRLGEVIERNALDLHRPPSFVRVAWQGADGPQLGAVRFEELKPRAAPLPQARLAASVGNDGRSLFVDVPPALPIERLVIRLPQVNQSERLTVYRHVAEPAARGRRLGLVPRRAPEQWVAVGTYDVHRVLREGAEVASAPLPFTWVTDRLRIDSPHGFGSELPTVEAEWRPARIAFAARAPGPWRLAAGRADAPAGPTVDLRAVLAADDPAGERLPRAQVESSAAIAAAAARRAERIAAHAHWSRWLLWAVLAAAVLGLAWMAWRIAAQLRAPAAPPQDGAST